MKSSSRERSISELESRWQLHRDCRAEVRQRGPHWGVFCGEHDHGIQWLRRDQVRELGLPVVGDLECWTRSDNTWK